MKTRMIRIKKSGRTARLWTYFADQCHLAKNLQNTANFYIRNLRTGLLKEEVKRSANESEVIRITEASIRQYNQNRHLAFRKKQPASENPWRRENSRQWPQQSR